MIRTGSKDIEDIKTGQLQVSDIYASTELVWNEYDGAYIEVKPKHIFFQNTVSQADVFVLSNVDWKVS